MSLGYSTVRYPVTLSAFDSKGQLEALFPLFPKSSVNVKCVLNRETCLILDEKWRQDLELTLFRVFGNREEGNLVGYEISDALSPALCQINLVSAKPGKKKCRLQGKPVFAGI
jgi:hypothetical protein